MRTRPHVDALPHTVRVAAAIALLVGCLGILGALLLSINARGPQQWTAPVAILAFAYLSSLAGLSDRGPVLAILSRLAERRGAADATAGSAAKDPQR